MPAMISLYDVRKVHRDVAEAITYRLLQERPPEANISHQVMPTMAEHAKYLENHPHRFWGLIQNEEGNFVGSVLLTTRNEIGIAILREHQGKGYASKGIELAMYYFPPLEAVPSVRTGYYVANINPANERSIKLFAKLGFTHIQNTYRAP